MRTLQLVTLALLVAALPVMADNFSVVSASTSLVPLFPFPSCTGGTVLGTSFASSSFNCVVASLTGPVSLNGFAEGQTGLGPYGIGASMSVNGSGTTDFSLADPTSVTGITSYEVNTVSDVSLSWSQDFVIEGAQGSGFADFTIDGFGQVDTTGAPGGFVMTLWNEFFDGDPSAGFPLFGNFQVPVTFGVPYGLTISGSCVFTSGEAGSCGSGAGGNISAEVTNLRFTDAAGNPLSGTSLVPVPERSTMLLLASAAGVVFLVSTRRRIA